MHEIGFYQVVHFRLVERSSTDVEEVLEALSLAESIQVEDKWCALWAYLLQHLNTWWSQLAFKSAKI